MQRITKGLTAVVACLIGLVVLPMAIPADSLRHSIQQALGERLGEPMRVERLRFTILPRIQLVAEGLATASGRLRVQRVEAAPVIRSLWSDRVILNEVVLEGLHLEPAILGPILGGDIGTGPQGVTIRRVRVSEARVLVGKLTFEGVDADIALRADGRPRRIYVTMEDGRVGLEVLPTASGALQLALKARDWRLLWEPRILVDEVQATAILEQRRLEAWNVQTKVGKGSAFGFVSLRWEPRWSLTGEFSLRAIPLGRLQVDARQPPLLEGLLDATPRFAARARHPEQLLARLELASDFSVRNVLVRRVDLPAAGGIKKNVSRKTGETRFEQVSGHVAMTRGRFAFTDLRARAGALMATGQVSVAPDRSLSGRIDAHLANSGGLLTVPLRVSGTLDDPRVHPTAAALAGAAVGSAILPGVGTALGAKAGQLAQDMIDFLRD